MSPTTAANTRMRVFQAVFEAFADRRQRPWTIAALLGIGAIAAISTHIGAVRTFYYSHDTFVMLAAGWRFVNGQVAHVDYESPWGPLFSVVFGAGLILRHNTAEGFGAAVALASGTLGVAAWALCRRRMFPVPAALASVGVALLACAPYPLGLRPDTLSGAMIYNRWGYALLAIVIWEAFTHPADKRDAFTGGIIGGAATAAALFLKASFFLVAVVFLLASLLAIRSLHRIAGLLVGMALVSIAVLAHIHFEIRAMLGDLAIAGNARSAVLSFWGLRWALFRQIPEFLPLLAAVVLLIWDPWISGEKSTIRKYSPLLAAALVFGAGGLLLFSNAQVAGYPLIAVLAVAALNETLRRGVGSPQIAPYRCVIIALAALCYLPPVGADAASLAYGLIQHHKAVPAGVERFQPPHLRDLVFMDVPEPRDWESRSNGAAYVEYINDGVDLVSKNTTAADPVMTFDIYDPLSYALLRKPPEGGAATMGFGNFSDSSKPSPERLFGNARIVMVPKYPSGPDANIADLERNYGVYLRSHFGLSAESSRWRLYRRQDASAAR